MKTSAQRNEYRLLPSDEARVEAALCRVLSIDTADHETLQRIAAHSIGCSYFDLRESEVAWIDEQIDALVTEAMEERR